MSIEDDNRALDPRVVAQYVAQEFQRIAGRPVTQEEQDYVGSLASGLKERGLDDDTTIGHLMTVKAAEKIVDKKIREKEMQIAANRLQDRASAIIDNSMRVTRNEDKKFGKIEVAVRAEVQKRFNADPVLKGQWDVGLLDADALEDLCDTVKDEFYKDVFELDKTKPGVATQAKPKDKTPEAPALEGGSSESGKTGSIDDFDDHQRAFYHSQVASLQRYGNKSEAEAEKIAHERASAMNSRAIVSASPRLSR